MVSEIPPSRIRLVALLILGVVLPAAHGCRSRAQQDLYQQKMIRDIRVLEDKLYEADYKNRILAEKLKRSRIEASEVPIHSAKPARRPQIYRQDTNREESTFEPTPAPKPSTGRSVPKRSNSRDDDSGDEIGLSDLLPPTFDEGDPVEPDTIDMNELGSKPIQPPESDPVPLTDPLPPTSPDDLSLPAFPGLNTPKPAAKPNEGSSTSPPSPAFTLPAPAEMSDPKSPKSNTVPRLLDPAPGGPVPPGKEDTELPPVLPGEQLPPQIGSPDEIKPPGQIKLPDSVKSNERLPDSLQIHPTLSGGNRIEEQLQDMLVVVNVVNNLGKTINLKDFLVDGEISVVVLDPKRDPSVARLGRWNFDRKQVRSFVKDSPVSGFHIPLDWTMDEPLGNEVIVHVRLRAEDDEMRCETKLMLDKQRGVAGWLPRAESFR